MKNRKKLLQDFTNHLSLIENKSSRSVALYENAVQRFLNFCISIELKEIRSYLRKISKDLSPNTQALHVSALRKFVQWAAKKSHIKSDFSAQISSPKKSQKKIRVFEEEDLVLLLKHLQERPLEEQLLFELLYSSGLRVGECALLERKNLDPKNKTLKVLGKGKRWRKIPMSKKAQEICSEIPENAELWPPHPSKEDLFRKWVLAWGKACSFEEHYGRLHPHKLRHALASHLLRRGASLLHIQRLLGHAQLSSTEKYTHLEKTHLSQKYDKALSKELK